MSRDTRAGTRRGPWLFFAGFALVALLAAGVLSYFADTDPDGLDTAVLEGCQVVATDQGEKLTGDCIARDAEDHALGEGPLADYTVGGDGRFTGVAGVLGVLATLLVSVGLFTVLRRRTGPRDTEPGDG